MSTKDNPKPRYFDMDKLPKSFPTHRHSDEFWECLGRVVASYGFLEEIIGRAIFALAVPDSKDRTVEKLDLSNKKLRSKLEGALTGTLVKLSDMLQKETKAYDGLDKQNVSELVSRIKEHSKYRNALCHGSWQVPDEKGKSLPRYVDREVRVFAMPVDANDLREIQKDVAETSIQVMETVTSLGIDFPGRREIDN